MWPKLELKQIVVKFAQEAEFRVDFWKVRAGVKVAKEAARREHLLTHTQTGYRACRRVAFINRTEFARIGCGDLGTPGCSATVAL